MTSAFCPAHITCFFRPVVSDSISESGSRGVGIRLRAGTTVHIDEIRGNTKVVIDGKADDAKITRHVLEHLAHGRRFEVNIECGLPPGQGFGMSASGAIAAALCISEMTGKSRAEAFEAAHAADAACGGGLGDVAGLMHEGDVPIRVKEGLPPLGRVINEGMTFERMTLAILGQKMSTAGVLRDSNALKRICEAGDAAMADFTGRATKELLFKISCRFSSEAGVKEPKVEEAIQMLGRNGIRSSMCMLGNSIFTDAPCEEVRAVLGEEIAIYSTSSTNEPACIIQKA